MIVQRVLLFEKEEVEEVVTDIVCRKELTTLWLRGNHLSSAFCKIIGGSSSSSFALTDIDLSGNHVGDKGLQHLCLFLDRCSNLQSLCVFAADSTASSCAFNALRFIFLNAFCFQVLVALQTA